MTSTEESSVPNLKYYRPPKTRPQQEESAHRERVEQQGKTAINYAKIQAWGTVTAVIISLIALAVAWFKQPACYLHSEQKAREAQTDGGQDD